MIRTDFREGGCAVRAAE